MLKKMKIWDSFTRVYHLSQLVLFGLIWYSAEQGDFESHLRYGYILASLLITRIIWGLIGSETSRFSTFIHLPILQLKCFLQSPRQFFHQTCIGHNPLAGYTVLIMLISLISQLFTGLFMSDEVLVDGPLYQYADENTLDFMALWHEYNFNFLLVIIACHIFAALLHQLSGDKVITSMITGHKAVSQSKTLFWQNSLYAYLIWLVMFCLFWFVMLE